MKHFSKRFITGILLFFSIVTNAQTGFFTDIAAPIIKSEEHRTALPQKSRILSLDTSALLTFLKNLTPQSIIEIPMPNGTVDRFHVWESTVMEPALAEKFPDLKTYIGQ